MKANSKACGPSERKETPAMEAKMHPKKFLAAALRKKSSPSTGGTSTGSIGSSSG